MVSSNAFDDPNGIRSSAAGADAPGELEWLLEGPPYAFPELSLE